MDKLHRKDPNLPFVFYIDLKNYKFVFFLFHPLNSLLRQNLSLLFKVSLNLNSKHPDSNIEDNYSIFVKTMISLWFCLKFVVLHSSLISN